MTYTCVYVYFIFTVAFRLYDLDRDDKISRDELLQVSRPVLCNNEVSQMLNNDFKNVFLNKE